MIDLDAIRIAARARLKADATLAALIGDVYSGTVPKTAVWTKPNLEIGYQDNRTDPASGYGQRGERVLLRLKAMDKGGVGFGDYGRCYAALVRAEAVLLASPITVAGMTIWDWRFASGIPESMPADASGVLWPQVGRIYSVRVDETP